MRRFWRPMLLLAASVAAPALAQQVVANVGFEGSEAARYDERRDEYIVSNLGPAGTGNDGFISRVAPDGTVRELKWIAGGVKGATLISPLGIYLKNDLVYVADIATIHLFDRSSGALRKSIPVEGAVRLNDLAVAADGTIYVSDSGSDDSPGALFRIDPAGKVSPFVARNPSLERVNGVALMADGSIVHGGRGVNIVIRRPNGEIIREQTLPTGRFDGIVLMPSGDLLVASQDGHSVYRVPVDGGKAVAVAKNIPIPAAIGLDTKRMRLLVPQIRAASLTIVQLTEPEAQPGRVGQSGIPEAVLVAVRAIAPTMKVSEAELKIREGRRYYDVEGTRPDGSEIELDVLEENGVWKVVEIQRDIPWTEVPAIARTAAGPVLRGSTPVRIIESKQLDGKIIYELFAAGRPETPAHEVLYDGRRATLLKEAWPH